LELNSSVAMVVMQFSFSNAKLVPIWISPHKKEIPEERTERKKHISGELFIEQTENCSVLEFVKDLGKSGYELVDAFSQERINGKNPKGNPYQMIRFVFVRNENVRFPDKFMEKRIPALGSLRGMCADATWRVRGFINPYYKDGEAVPKKHAISINLEVRKPLRYSEGPPIMVWPKDENGRSMKDTPGAEKVRLAPDWHLLIKDNVISLVEA